MKWLLICMGVWLLALLGGCQVIDMQGETREELDYVIVSSDELSDELRGLIEEKKENDFQMTYQDGDDLYLIRGYGQQEMGGYSIQVQELSVSESAITLSTTLLGPEKDENSSLVPSYPYIVLKIEYTDLPVQFQ